MIHITHIKYLTVSGAQWRLNKQASSPSRLLLFSESSCNLSACQDETFPSLHMHPFPIPQLLCRLAGTPNSSLVCPNSWEQIFSPPRPIPRKLVVPVSPYPFTAFLPPHFLSTLPNPHLSPFVRLYSLSPLNSQSCSFLSPGFYFHHLWVPKTPFSCLLVPNSFSNFLPGLFASSGLPRPATRRRPPALGLRVSWPLKWPSHPGKGMGSRTAQGMTIPPLPTFESRAKAGGGATSQPPGAGTAPSVSSGPAEAPPLSPSSPDARRTTANGSCRPAAPYFIRSLRFPDIIQAKYSENYFVWTRSRH